MNGAAEDLPYPLKDEIVSTGERFFVSLKKKDFISSWDLLSGRSREEIAMRIRKEIRASGGDIDIKAIHDDFRSYGPISKSYWSSFMARFNPDAALEESRWEIEVAGPLQAVLRISHRTSERPALLRLFREEGGWKVGFTESFVRPGGP